MNKRQFIEILGLYKELSDNIHKYYQFGIDLIEVEHSPVTPIDKIIQIIFKSIYNNLGIDWINWFIYETDFGDKYMEATDDGKLICQTVEDLYDYIEQYKLY